jgi:hypothetical protein
MRLPSNPEITWEIRPTYRPVNISIPARPIGPSMAPEVQHLEDLERRPSHERAVDLVLVLKLLELVLDLGGPVIAPADIAAKPLERWCSNVPSVVAKQQIGGLHLSRV